MKFKVGDKVICNDDNYSNVEGVIVKVVGDKLPYLVSSNLFKYEVDWFVESELTPTTSATPQQPKQTKTRSGLPARFVTELKTDDAFCMVYAITQDNGNEEISIHTKSGRYIADRDTGWDIITK